MVAIRPRMSDFPVKAVMRLKASTIRPKYSGGPKARAYSASIGPKAIKPMTLRVPPTKDPMVAIPRAIPARPCLAI